MFGSSDDVLVEDEFLRDGLQNEARLLPLDDKLAFVRGLEAAGVRRIQLGSFVNPARVPQMADTDALFSAVERRPGVTYTALVLNMAGLERALAVGAPHLSISVSASESHSRANVGKPVDEALAHIAPVIARALAAGVTVRAGIQSAFGCGFEGRIAPERVVAVAKVFDGLGVHEINLADTAGLGNPRQVHELTGAVRAAVRPDLRLSLHLHDTRGLGLANMVAGLQAGVRIFDAALGGLGGCPFIPAASGNIATEDAVFALEEMGFATGIDWQALAALSRRLEGLLERRLPGRMARIAAPDVAPNVAKG